MCATDVIDLANSLGVALNVRPGGVLAASPSDAITPELAAGIRANKPGLIAALSGQPYAGSVWLRHLTDDLLEAGAELVLRGGRAAAEPADDVPDGAMATIEAHQPELIETLVTIGVPDLAKVRDPVCRCGSPDFRETRIHDGRSIRRDCAACGRFVGFSHWYTEPAITPNPGAGNRPQN